MKTKNPEIEALRDNLTRQIWALKDAVEEIRRDHQEQIRRLKERIKELEAGTGDLPDSIKQALNPSDGSYSP